MPKEKINTDLKLKTTRYSAGGGDEYFLEMINRNNILFGLCRLRIRKNGKKNYGGIRELHVYGSSIKIGKRAVGQESVQHKGIGTALVKKAEEIAKKNGVKKLFVIAGVGVRHYFYKLGYKPDGFYVSKTLG